MNGFSQVFAALVTRPIKREKSRSLLTISGIAVGVSVLVAIQLANQSAIRSFEETVEAVAGRANYQITPSSGTLDQEILIDLQPFWASGVRFAPVIDRDGILVERDLPVRILAVDLLSDLQFRDYRFTRVAGGASGDEAGAVESWFLRLFADRSVLLPASFARDLGLEIGDHVTIRLGGASERMTLRAVLESDGPAAAFDGAIVIMDIAVAQSAFPPLGGTLSRIDVLSDEDPSLIAALRGTLPDGVVLERPARRAERVDQMLTAFRVNLLALSAVSLIVGIFLVYNTVLVSVLRRRGVIGTMKTLGVAPIQIFAAFLLEGALLGLIGAIAGIVLGLGLARSMLELVSRTVSTLYVRTAPGSIELGGEVIFGAIAVGIVISLIAALQPAAEAARVRPLSLLRASRLSRISPRRIIASSIVGIVLLILAAIASRIPPAGTISVGGYTAVLLIIAGFSLLTPAALGAAARLLRWPFAAWFRIPGRLAAASMPVSLRRTAVAAAALAIAIAMMVAVSMMIGSFRETVDAWVAQTVASDIWLRPVRSLDAAPASFPPGILEDLGRIDVVEAADPFRGREILIGDLPFLLGSGDFETLARHGRLPMIDPSDAPRTLRNAKARDQALVSESFATRLEMKVGDTIDLPVPSGVVPIQIAGIYRDYSTDRGIVVIDRSNYLELYDDPDIDTIGIYLREGADPESARRTLEEALSARWGAFAFTNRTIRDEVLRIFDQTFVITWALLGIALTVAILGIISTLSALILERRREIALLRVTGMRRREIRTMVVLEAAILGITATVFGVVCGYLLSLVLIFVINRQSFGWTIAFSPPWLVVALSIVVTFLATIAAGFASSKLADHVHIAREIHAE